MVVDVAEMLKETEDRSSLSLPHICFINSTVSTHVTTIYLLHIYIDQFATMFACQSHREILLISRVCLHQLNMAHKQDQRANICSRRSSL